MSGVYQRILQQPISDHYPICLQADGIQWGPIPFQPDNKWLKDLKFGVLIEATWKNIVIQGNASYRLTTKLKELKIVIKELTRNERRKEGEDFTNIMNEISKID